MIASVQSMIDIECPFCERSTNCCISKAPKTSNAFRISPSTSCAISCNTRYTAFCPLASPSITSSPDKGISSSVGAGAHISRH
ncbi:hypothetical protein BC629DRAFT_1522309 [Irpex lacteus]|nr:hypothetical protein BC629DRAFT_1522309 [Irpex lacteus]